MPNTTSASLKLTVQATGENSGTWGQITNTNLLILEQAIGGYAGVALNATTGATLTFSNGALSDGKNQVLKLTGTITTNVDVIVPDSVEKTYVVENATSGAFTVTVKTTSGSGVTWGTTDKGKKLIYSDGTNILEGISSIDTLKVSTFTSTGIDDNATSTAITINSSEQVGIGQSNPQNNLDIATSGFGQGITIKTTGNTSNSIISDANRTTASAGILSLTSKWNGTTVADILFNAGSDTINKDDGIITFRTSSANNNAERMRITSTGNVGIGTTAPDALLSVNGVASFGDGTALLPSIANFGDLNTGMWFPAADTIAFSEGGAEAMRIDSSGNVGIGTSSPSTKLEVSSSGNTVIKSKSTTSNTLGGFEAHNNTGTSYLKVFQLGSAYGGTTFGGVTGNDQAVIEGQAISSLAFTTQGGTPDIIFAPARTARMTIKNGGAVLMGKTVLDSGTTAGFEFSSSCTQVTRNADVALVVNRLTNDGVLVVFRQNTTDEGNISVSGSTVSYNGFTGTHWSRFTDNSTPTILRGTVLESLDEMCDWYNLEFDLTTTTQDEDGNDVTNTHTEKVPHVLADGQSDGDTVAYSWNTGEKDSDNNAIMQDVQTTIVKEGDVKHVKSKVSDTVDAKNVYGVFVAYDEDGEGYNDFYVASVGSFVVRIKANETIAKGDLLQSNGDGTAKVQTDDAVRSSSFAKVLSTTIIETYEDGSYLVPCSLMC
jgi:hypothetical protein